MDQPDRVNHKPFSSFTPPFEFENMFASGHINVDQAYTWEKFDFPFWRRWMSQNFHVPVLLASIYLTLIFVGRRWMSYRQPYRLKIPLVLWNVVFATFSLVAFWRTFPDLWKVVSQNDAEGMPLDGFYKSVCSSDGLTVQFAFWSWIGTLSKIAELGDTLFIVLRKQPLILLHWFHHSTTLLYVWFTFPQQEPCHRWLMTMNFFVHILMYTYHAFRAAGIKLPKLSALIITSIQIVQMIIGIFINWYTWKEMNSERGCERYQFNLIVAAIMYTSYFVLFAKFFYNAYFKPVQVKRE